LLNRKSDAQAQSQADSLSLIKNSKEDIVEVVSFNRKILQDATTHETKQRHEETIAAILSLRDGSIETVLFPTSMGEKSS